MGLRLFFLRNFLGTMFIQGGKFIPDSRVRNTWMFPKTRSCCTTQTKVLNGTSNVSSPNLLIIL